MSKPSTEPVFRQLMIDLGDVSDQIVPRRGRAKMVEVAKTGTTNPTSRKRGPTATKEPREDGN